MRRTGVQHSGESSPARTVTPVIPSPTAESVASSGNTGSPAQGGANIQEVAPWVDLDAGISLPSSEESAVPDGKAGTLSPRKESRRRRIGSRRDRHGSGDVATTKGKEGARKSVFVRARNPMAKLFDGADSEYDGGGFANAMDESESSLRRREERSSEVRVMSPVPVRWFRMPGSASASPVKGKRRGAIYTDVEGSGSGDVVGDDPFVDRMSSALVDFVPGPRAAETVVFINPFEFGCGKGKREGGEEKGSEEIGPDVVC